MNEVRGATEVCVAQGQPPVLRRSAEGELRNEFEDEELGFNRYAGQNLNMWEIKGGRLLLGIGDQVRLEL